MGRCNSWGRRVGHDWVTELNWTKTPKFYSAKNYHANFQPESFQYRCYQPFTAAQGNKNISRALKENFNLSNATFQWILHGKSVPLVYWPHACPQLSCFLLSTPFEAALLHWPWEWTYFGQCDRSRFDKALAHFCLLSWNPHFQVASWRIIIVSVEDSYPISPQPTHYHKHSNCFHLHSM